MDPTAPKDNPTPPASPAQRGEPASPDASLDGPPNDPIQPGGFVVSDDADKVFRQSASPAQRGEPASPVAEGEPRSQRASLGGPPPKINLAGPASPAQRGEPASPTLPATPPPTPDSPPPVPPTPTSPLSPPLPAAKMQQPNPAPYEPPPGETQAQSGSSSKIDKLRLLTIGLGALFVIILAAALGWFFFIGRPSQEAANVQIEETEVEEPSPPPKNKTGGFAILPTPSEATPEATPSAAP